MLKSKEALEHTWSSTSLAQNRRVYRSMFFIKNTYQIISKKRKKKRICTWRAEDEERGEDVSMKEEKTIKQLFPREKKDNSFIEHGGRLVIMCHQTSISLKFMVLITLEIYKFQFKVSSLQSLPERYVWVIKDGWLFVWFCPLFFLFNYLS